MSAVVKWWSRLAAVVSGAVFALVVPVHAWAVSTGVDGLAIEAAKRRRSRGFGFFPILGGVCCLLVVAAIVLAFVMISRRKRR